MYDSYRWMATFGDPSFEFHAAAAKIWGSVAIRLADAPVLPFDYTRTGDDLQKYLAVITAATAKSAVAAEKALDFSLMTAAVAAFAAAAAKAKADAAAAAGRADELERRMLNDRFLGAQRAFLVPEGLRGRPWYKHAVFSPAENNAYASAKFPSVSDALAAKDWAEAQLQIAVAARAIERAATILRGA